MKMMLTNNKFERYQHASMPSTMTMTTTIGSSASSSPTNCGSSVARAERESIHSGQFMVSHFEAEEAQEDDLDDSEVKMLDPDDPSLSKPDEANTCTEVQLYVPRKVAQLHQQGFVNTGVGNVTSHLEIETSLTKLFKCMNLAYSQKLTSPKWNHFKGVRLRWKDKIRLNNVIWRCWHMQFILKRRTPVCQFASPLDVDVHSNPQTVVLEGKYWKRQLTVIKAEYRKWRRHFKSRVTGCLTYDTRSEFEFLEWSPLNDRSLMLSDDWTSDTLFSAINGPFPFPDSREIARGAGIADFMQPSLGPLQPNLEDLDTLDDILIRRLAPVPEEGADEMLKSMDYGFSAIMNSEQMDSTNIMDEMSTLNNNIGSISANDDANMLELNTPLSTMQYADIEQQFTTRSNQNTATTVECTLMGSAVNNHMLMNSSIPGAGERIGVMLANAPTSTTDSTSRAQTKPYVFPSGNSLHSPSEPALSGRQQQHQPQGGNDYPSKSVMKGRVAKNFQRTIRREPHNYDKAQPTLHQTTIYQQMLAEQQKNQQQQHTHQQQQQQQQHHLQPLNTFQHQQQLHFAQTQFPQTNLENKSGFNDGNTGNYTAEMPSSASTATANNNILGRHLQLPQHQAQPLQQNTLMLNVKTEPPNTDVLSMFNLTQSNGIYGQSTNNSALLSSNAYKPYPNAASFFKKSSSTGTFVGLRGSNNSTYVQQETAQQLPNTPLSLSMQLGAHPTNSYAHIVTQTQLQSPNANRTNQPQQQHEQALSSSQSQVPQQQVVGNSNAILPKEMYRSNSLPLNVTLQNLEGVTAGNRVSHDSFAVPKYHAKSHKSRSRSNSIHQGAISVNTNSNNSNSNQSMQLSSSLGGSTNTAGAAANNIFVAPAQLQTAISDPMITSALAQLLTTNNRIVKQQSSSTSAISSPNLGATLSNVISQPAQRLNMPGMLPTSVVGSTPPSKPPSQSMPTTTVNSSIFMSPTQSSSSSSSLVGIASISSSPTAAHDLLMQHHQQQQQQQQRHQSQHTPMQAMQQHQQPPLSKSPKKSTSLPTPVMPNLLHSPPQTKTLSYPLTTSAQSTVTQHLNLSPESFHEQDSPLSPTHSIKYPRDSQRRAGHIHAEQKRRYNIKNGFDLLHSLIPQLQQNPNAKSSKAAMLQKGSEHIITLCRERNQLKDKMDMLRQERDTLTNSLNHLHSILPANGAPVTRQGTEHVRQLYEQYIKYRTMNNWKFWILGLILEPLLTSYTASVSSANMEEMRRTASSWVDQHCSLIDLRSAVSNKLTYLSMKTDILSDPRSTLQEEVAKAVKNSSGQHPNLHGT